MVKELSSSTVTILLERLDQLNERISDHSTQFRNSILNLVGKVDEIRNHQHKDKEELLKKIQDVELGYIKADGATNVKIASISATVAFLVSLIMIILKSKLGL